MTRLGTDKELRKGGRYGRVMGTLWRHKKREKCGRAAMGLLLDIWSWCADQGEKVVTEKSMRRIINGDPNGRRQVKELVDAGFLDVIDGGYAPHDWQEHVPTQALRDEDATGLATQPVTGLVTRDVTRDVMNPGAVNIKESPSPRAHASPNSPSPISQGEEREEIEKRADAGAVVPMARVFGGTGEPRNDAVAPHPESEAAQLQLIRERFAAGLKHTCQATATWTDSNVRQLKVFSKWLGDQDGDARRILDRTLAGFFADPRAADAGFPIAFLAGTPDKYLRPPLPPARASPGRGKLTPTRGTTEKDTANAPDEAEQLAALQKQWGSHGRA